MQDRICGVVLAGGRARRFGGELDKALLELGGRRLVDRTIERARPQTARLILNANGDPARFGALDVPIVPDVIGGFAGPLAGVHAALLWARATAPACTHVASFAVDTPFFDLDLVQRLAEALDSTRARIATAASNERLHPAFTLWPLDLAEPIEQALAGGHSPALGAFIARFDPVTVDYSRRDGLDPFFNINTPGDLSRAEGQLTKFDSASCGGM